MLVNYVTSLPVLVPSPSKLDRHCQSDLTYCHHEVWSNYRYVLFFVYIDVMVHCSFVRSVNIYFSQILPFCSVTSQQKLCDKVPSYDSKIAFATIEKELGKPVDELFSEITPEPVAAASLGQVYKATLRATGETVAVKVQRPGVLETVSLDLHMARELGLILRNFPQIVDRLDAVELLDEFAFRFYQELDYNLECENGIRIAEDMSVLPMVVIPKNYPEYTSRRVHVAGKSVGKNYDLSLISVFVSLIQFSDPIFSLSLFCCRMD